MQPILHVEEAAAARPGRLRAAWRAAHQPVAGVSRRVQLVAYAVPFTVLPSSIRRLPAAFDDGIGAGQWVYVVFLSILSEALAFIAIGLIARWGEVFPRWVPVLRGHPIPTKAAVVPAAIGAMALTLVCTVIVPATEVMGVTIRGDDVSPTYPGQAGGWEAAWFSFCYTPLVLWGPLLAVLTVAYGKRRRRATRTVPVTA